MNKATDTQIENLKRLLKVALASNIESDKKGLFTHFLQILKDIDATSTFQHNLSLEYIQLTSALPKPSKQKAIIAIMEESIKYYSENK